MNKHKPFIRFISVFAVLVFLIPILQAKAYFSPAKSLVINAPSAVCAGKVFNVTVTVSSSVPNKNFPLTVWFEVNPVGISIPSPFTFDDPSNRTHIFEFVSTKSEKLSIKVFQINGPNNSDEVNVKILPSDPVKISVSPNILKLGVGQKANISATILDKYNNIVADALTKWNVYSQNGGKVTVGNGIVKGVSPGKCIITVQSGKLRAVCVVEVENSVIEELTVSLNPSTVRTYSEYTIRFKNKDEVIKEGSPLYIVFTDQFAFPCPCHKHIRGSEIFVNGVSCPENPKIFYTPRAMEIFLPKDIAPHQSVEVKISSTAEIMSPPQSGTYDIGIAFSLNEIPVVCNVNIVSNGISSFSTQIEPNISGNFAKWAFSFYLGGDLAIRKNDSLILFFPKKIKLPDSINSSYVQINGEKIIGNSLTVGKSLNFVKILSPISIANGSKVVISFDSKAGVKTPYVPGYYRIKILSSNDITPVYSNYFYVRFSPIVSVNYSIKGKMVSEDLFNSDVNLSFNSFSNMPGDKVAIYYSVDSKGEVLYNGKELTFPDGKYRIKFFAKSKYGVLSNLQAVSFSVDTVPPKIRLTEPSDGETVYSKYLKISGTVSEDSNILLINGVNVPLDAGRNFTQLIVLKTGENAINISAIDYAKNVSIKKIKVFYKPEMPFLRVNLDSHIKFGFTVAQSVNLNIKTNPYSKVTILTKSGPSVFKLNKEGTFQYRVPLEKGENRITIYSQNIDDNTVSSTVNIERAESMTILYVSSKEYVSQFNKHKQKGLLDCVVLKSGRTFVDLKSFSKISGDTFNVRNGIVYSTNKGIMINVLKKTFIFNGKSSVFPSDSIPFYDKNGNIMLPLRFIFEEFGYKLRWVEKAKAIIIFN